MIKREATLVSDYSEQEPTVDKQQDRRMTRSTRPTSFYSLPYNGREFQYPTLRMASSESNSSSSSTANTDIQRRLSSLESTLAAINAKLSELTMSSNHSGETSVRTTNWEPSFSSSMFRNSTTMVRNSNSLMKSVKPPVFCGKRENAFVGWLFMNVLLLLISGQKLK